MEAIAGLVLIGVLLVALVALYQNRGSILPPHKSREDWLDEQW